MQDIPLTSTRVAQLEKAVYWLSKRLNWVAAVILIAMMVLTDVHVLGRYLFNKPIVAVFDVSEVLCVCVVVFALAQTQILRLHISVKFLVAKLRRRPRGIIGAIGCLLSFGLFSVLARQCIVYGIDLWRAGTATVTARIPVHPFLFLLAFACGLLCLVLLLDFLKSLREARGR